MFVRVPACHGDILAVGSDSVDVMVSFLLVNRLQYTVHVVLTEVRLGVSFKHDPVLDGHFARRRYDRQRFLRGFLY